MLIVPIRIVVKVVLLEYLLGGYAFILSGSGWIGHARREKAAMDMDSSQYYTAQPENRRIRLLALRERILLAFPGAEENMRYKMPTFEMNGNWVALANQQSYVCVYFCCADLVKDITRKHPKLSTGTGCVRVRDTQEVPTDDLLAAMDRAFAMEKPESAKGL